MHKVGPFSSLLLSLLSSPFNNNNNNNNNNRNNNSSAYSLLSPSLSPSLLSSPFPPLLPLQQQQQSYPLFAVSFISGKKKVKRYSSRSEIWMLIINAICILHYLVNPSLNLVHRIEINFSLTLFPLQQKLY